MQNKKQSAMGDAKDPLGKSAHSVAMFTTPPESYFSHTRQISQKKLAKDNN